MRPAVLYLRSSKDRSDVSPDAQRKILTELAGRRGLAIVREYVDVVLSGKDENRPAFLELRRDMKTRPRGWDLVLMLDVERLARNRHIASAFEFEAEQHGIEVLYANLPESTPMVDMILKPMMHGMAQYFSWQSKMKGRAGMRENVARGFRAGGRAPFGYALEHVAQGAIREGKPVLKSRLVPTEKAALITAYLKGRAAGRKGTELARAIGLDLSRSTLTGIEWNALTYAGHTVWNVHNEMQPGGYKGGAKRRPRAEWAIQRNTHLALITEDEAEAILHSLANNAGQGKRPRSTTSASLLSGILKTRDGRQWHVDRGGRFYRAGTRSIKASTIEARILGRVLEDLDTDRFALAVMDKARRAIEAEAGEAPVAGIDREIGDRERRIGRLTALVADTDTPAPLLREMERLEAERQALVDKRATAHQKARQMREMGRVTPSQLREGLAALADRIRTAEPDRRKGFLRAFVESIELDPGSSSARICYSIRPSGRDTVASPAGFAQYPTIKLVSVVRLPERKRARSIPQKRAA